MKVIVDDKIPFIKEAIEKIADEVVYAPGKDFTPSLVKDADALIIRTRTRCNRELLEGSKVKFIATATIGFDHIDAEYCREAGITWTNAPGCNSASVAQYLQSSLILLQTLKGINLPEVTIGIIGVGNVGSKVAKVAQELGMRVLLNDLPREDKEGKQGFSSLQTLAEECDILTFHLPLYKEGKYKTCHLADDAFFQSLKRKPVIINTSRGEIIETGALLNALETGLISDAIIDVWENEPAINLTLLDKVFLGTPHRRLFGRRQSQCNPHVAGCPMPVFQCTGRLSDYSSCPKPTANYSRYPIGRLSTNVRSPTRQQCAQNASGAI